MIRFIFKYSKFLETTQLILSAKFQTLTFGEGTPPPHTHCKKTSVYYVIFGSQNERQKWRKLFFFKISVYYMYLCTDMTFLQIKIKTISCPNLFIYLRFY